MGTDSEATACRVLIDRVEFGSDAEFDRVPEIPGYKVKFDCRLDHSAADGKGDRRYGRIRKLISVNGDIELTIQYQPVLPVTYPTKIQVRPVRTVPIPAQDLATVWRIFGKCRMLLLELAFDFDEGIGIDRKYIQLRGKFGKSRYLQLEVDYPIDYWGGRARRYAKLVRAYYKPELGVFRVELEMHSRQLRDFGLRRFRKWSDLKTLLVPNHIRFVRLDWDQLSQYCCRAGISDRVITEARKLCFLHERLKVLREAGVLNVHRFLVSSKKNRLLRAGLRNFVDRYRSLTSLYKRSHTSDHSNRPKGDSHA